MIIRNAQFAGSSTKVDGRPSPRLPEFAFIGRSNVGKSSLINMLTGRKKLAMTSGTPGKTRLVNHFLIDGRWYLVDLPGYGYAKVSDKQRDAIRDLIRDYILNSEELVVLFVLLDARHPMQKIDLDFIAGLGEAGVPFALVFTKGDKLGPVALKKQVEANCAVLLEEWEELPPVFVSSSETALGKEDILNYIGSLL